MQTGSQPGKWARALHRAEANNVLVLCVESMTEGYDTLEWWKAKSVSRPDRSHGIRVEYTAEGVDVICSCEGGQKQLPCMHAAQVLRAAGMLPNMMLVESEPEPIAA